MIRHFIIMSSSYKQGKRIALDYKGAQLTNAFLSQQIKIIKDQCGDDVSISSHFIYAENESWAAVVKADSFFRGVYVTETLNGFIDLVKEDLVLNGVDVAKYILSKTTCSHLRLQKLVYLAYADYLMLNGDQLFSDKILAYKYGPVVESVYKKYKNYGYSVINEENITQTDALELPIRSRILFSSNGIEKLTSIDNTLNRYGKFPVGKLVDITHEEETPWRKTPQSEVIADKTIYKYHINELIITS